jgi:hypothetical protein
MGSVVLWNRRNGKVKLQIYRGTGKRKMMSILSGDPDGMGYYYGWLPGDNRQINVRKLHTIALNPKWHAYVGGVRVEGGWDSKEEAEAAAIKWAKEHPEND